MQLTSNWGPGASGAGFGAIQDLNILIDFGIFGTTFNPGNTATSMTATGVLNGQTITIVISGVGFSFDNTGNPLGTGTIQSLQYFSGTSLGSDTEILSVSGSVSMAALQTVIDADGSGADDTAVEEFFTMFDWNYNGTNSVDFLTANATSVDGAPFMLQGNDRLVLAGGNDAVFAAGGNDTLLGGAGFDTLLGDQGNDLLDGGDQADLLNGGDGNDQLLGGGGADVLLGGNGNDTLNSGDEADRLYGGAGNDLLRGGWAAGTTVDGLWGEAGNDTLLGELGYDLLDGGTGNDLLDGGNQADNLYGQAGNDTLRGGQGFDRLLAGDGDDFARGGSEDDGIFGGAGNDTLNGESGNDRMFGETGDDRMDGATGNDTLSGGAGFDKLIGGAGNDVLAGNFNADTFVFANGHGRDTITDFDALNDLEKIDLSGVSAVVNMFDLLSNHATQVGQNVVIDTGGGNSITLNSTNLANLDSADFIF